MEFGVIVFERYRNAVLHTCPYSDSVYNHSQNKFPTFLEGIEVWKILEIKNFWNENRISEENEILKYELCPSKTKEAWYAVSVSAKS